MELLLDLRKLSFFKLKLNQFHCSQIKFYLNTKSSLLFNYSSMTQNHQNSFVVRLHSQRRTLFIVEDIFGISGCE